MRNRIEYVLEAVCLGLFMVSASVFGVLLFHPASPVVRAIPDAWPRRTLMGAAMGLTAVALIHSPMGRRSGAHMNPSVTLAFWRLGKAPGKDVAGYLAAQFAGGIGGMLVAWIVLGHLLAVPEVDYVATVPGRLGLAPAFAAELVISFLLMLVVLAVMSRPRLMPHTGWFAGALVFLFITFEAPISGMSMNPARTLGSAVLAGAWAPIWIYFTAPPLGMWLAAELFARLLPRAVPCAKMCHRSGDPCLFCDYAGRRLPA